MQNDMSYEMEELLPIVIWLTEKYTSKESSSVPYETAQVLLKAVMYCIDECISGNQTGLVSENAKLSARAAYERGYEVIFEKVREAKVLYDQIIQDFEDYRCKNYSDTILKGMPGFFTRYDARFSPQEHLLTLDYPLLSGNPDLCGIDLILAYLKGIHFEKQILDCFDQSAIRNLLEKIRPGYQNLYLDNVCYPVLLGAIGCLIADRPVHTLQLSKKDYGDIRLYFRGDNAEKIKLKIQKIIHMIISQIQGLDDPMYFDPVCSSYAVRISEGLRNHSLENVMVSTL